MITSPIMTVVDPLFILFSRIMRVLPAGLTGALMLISGFAGDAAADAASRRPVLSISVHPSDRSRPPRTFAVVLVCDTAESRARGLQGFRPLAPGEAALFVLDPPQRATFWMGTVAYPIAIFFVDPSGTVVRAYPRCEPGSREVFPSGVPVKWVIETAAGSGIRTGDRIRIERPGPAAAPSGKGN